MATVLNRTTKALIQSVNTPDYPVETWIINPDLSNVTGVDSKYWKITGDTISEMSSEEKLAVDNGATNLAELKARRYAEIDAKTQSLILVGFVYDGSTFSLSLAAQQNWQTLELDERNSWISYPKAISTKDNYEHNLVDAADLLAFVRASFDTVSGYVDSGRALKKLVSDSSTKAEVDLVIDGR